MTDDIETLRRERDEWKRLAENCNDEVNRAYTEGVKDAPGMRRDHVAILERERDQARAEVARLRERVRNLDELVNALLYTQMFVESINDTYRMHPTVVRARETWNRIGLGLSPAPSEPACATCGGTRFVPAPEEMRMSHLPTPMLKPCPSCAPAKQAEAGERSLYARLRDAALPEGAVDAIGAWRAVPEDDRALCLGIIVNLANRYEDEPRRNAREALLKLARALAPFAVTP